MASQCISNRKWNSLQRVKTHFLAQNQSCHSGNPGSPVNGLLHIPVATLHMAKDSWLILWLMLHRLSTKLAFYYTAVPSQFH